MNYEGDINYIKQLNAFYDLLQCNQLNTSAHVLYHVLLMINNKCGWSEWFQRTNQSLCGFTGINEKTLVTSRNILKQRGFIDFVPAKKKGDITKYKIVKLYDETSDDAIINENKTVQNGPKITPYVTPNVTPISGTQSTDISKLNKNQKETNRYCNQQSMSKVMDSTVEMDVIKTGQSGAVDFYEKNIAKEKISSGLRDDILKAVKQYGEDLVIAALERTMSMANRPNWKYAQKILLSSDQNTNTSGINMPKHNKFLSFPQTKYNFEEIERMVLQDQIRRYEKQKAVEGIT